MVFFPEHVAQHVAAENAVEFVFGLYGVDLAAALGEAFAAEEDDLRVCIEGAGRKLAVDLAAAEHVVAVDKVDEFALCRFEPRVARGGRAAVCLVDDAYAGVEGSELVAQVGAAVGRTVVDKDDVIIAEGLVKHGADTFFQIFFRVVNRDDYC